MHPEATVAGSVREVTHRLRTISSACNRVGIPGQLYMNALDTIGRETPHVDVTDIYW